MTPRLQDIAGQNEPLKTKCQISINTINTNFTKLYIEFSTNKISTLFETTTNPLTIPAQLPLIFKLNNQLKDHLQPSERLKELRKFLQLLKKFTQVPYERSYHLIIATKKLLPAISQTGEQALFTQKSRFLMIK